jgi:glutaredoxin
MTIRPSLLHGRGLRAAALGLAALGWLGCDLPPPPGGSRAKLDSDSGAPAQERSGGGLASIESEEEARQVYYQFVDASGAVRFVPTLDAVPPEWRSRVGFVEMSSPPPLSPADAQRIREKRTAHVVLRERPAAGADSGGEKTGDADSSVVLYGADWCGACRRAKEFMDENSIAYDERNVDEERWRDEMVAKAGPGGIPVIDVGGQILRGFNPQRLQQLLGGA